MGINELGFGLAGAVAMLVWQHFRPALRKMLDPQESAARSEPDTAESATAEPWWLKMVLDALRQLKEGYDLTVTVKPREEK